MVHITTDDLLGGQLVQWTGYYYNDNGTEYATRRKPQKPHSTHLPQSRTLCVNIWKNRYRLPELLNSYDRH